MTTYLTSLRPFAANASQLVTSEMLISTGI